MSKIKDEPAQGERNAITGYYPQYRISAALIIEGLRSGNLQWIAVADPTAGRVDDFQIATETSVDAYQFKWSRYPGNFTFNDLVKKSDSTPSLIEQLADGWRRLGKSNANKRVVVHLMTNETPSISKNTTLPIRQPVPEHPHFSAFIEQVWKVAQNTPLSDEFQVPQPWQAAWENIQSESGLGKNEFFRFVRDCNLEFGCNLPQPEETSLRDAEIYENDLNHVTEKIFRAVYEPQQIIRLRQEELLDFLNWKSRFEFRNQHEFPIDDVLYQPIEASQRELEQAINRLENGYLGVIGSPGSGKSTLLTQVLRYFPQRVIRYYAFVPSGQGANVRGESQNFLHDIVTAIEKAGFSVGNSPSNFDVAHLREKLHKQLQLLHQDWLETNRKTIILVDGLDHIPREQNPVQSLLNDLPLPEQIPAGIIFVLGSQTDELGDLPTSIQISIRSAERRIEMKSLERLALRKIIEKTSLLNYLTEEQVTNIEILSSGHPLALIYLLRQLEMADSSENIGEILQSTPPYDGKIEVYYQSIWRLLDSDDELGELLGLVSRMRGGIDLAWVRTWAPKPVIRRLQRLFSHLFRIAENDIWYFFHNSFRLFLIERTAWTAPNKFDEKKDREFYLELAEKYRDSSEQYQQWEEIYYLFQAKSNKELLEKASPPNFRKQFFNFRSLKAIRGDILLAFRAAHQQNDFTSFVRELLIDAEMAQREANLEDLPIISILLSLGEYDSALEYLQDGQQLRVSAITALENSITLQKLGLKHDALSLFELAEPLEYISGAKMLRHTYDENEHKLLEGWAKAAAYFRPINKFVAGVGQIKVEPEKYNRHGTTNASENKPRSLRKVEANKEKAKFELDGNTWFLHRRLLFKAGLELINQEKWDELRVIQNELYESEIDESGLWFALQIRSWKAFLTKGDIANAEEVLAHAIENIKPINITDVERIVIAEAIFLIRNNKEEAQTWLDSAKALESQSYSNFNVTFGQFRHLLRYSQLLYTFGETRPPSKLIPLPQDLTKQPATYCERGVCFIAEIVGSAWRGQILDQATLKQKTSSLLRLFYHNRNTDYDNWAYWYPFVSGIKNEFYENLISAVSLHSKDAIQSLAEDFAVEWANNQTFWDVDNIRHITIFLYNFGASEEWASRQFELLSDRITNEEMYSRIVQKVELSEAWMKIGRFDVSKKILFQALIDSSSIGRKDYQLNVWLDWLRRINRHEPHNANKRVAWFAHAVIELERNGGPSEDAARNLLEVTFEWSPRRAIKLFSWFLDKGIIKFERAVRSLLQGALSLPLPPIDFITKILIGVVLPIGTPDKKIIKSIIYTINAQDGEDKAIQFIKYFLNEVAIYSLPSDKRRWRRFITEWLLEKDIPLPKAGLDIDDLNYDDDYETGNSLKLSDGTVLKKAEIKRKAQTFEGLCELMEKKIDGFYSWDEIIGSLLPKLKNPEAILKISDFFYNVDQYESPQIINSLQKRLFELGDTQNASQIAKKIISQSTQSGWALRLGGKTKIEAYKTLVDINGNVARQQAFNDLIKDLSGTYRYSSSILYDLEEIIPLITDQISEKDIWAEIEQYLQNTFSSIDAEDVNSEWLNLPDESSANDTPTNALFDLLQLNISHPINLIAHSSQLIFLALLLEGDKIAGKRLRELFNSDERDLEAGLMILDAASIKNEKIVDELNEELKALLKTQNFALRIVMQQILTKIDVSVQINKKSITEFNPFYSLDLPSGPNIEEVLNNDAVKPEEFLPETDDSYELLGIVLIELEFVAEIADLPKENVVERAAQIARTLATKDKWNSLGEREMRSQFNGIGMRYAYRRPRATMARHALFHLISELFDSGLLKSENLKDLKPVLQFYDPDSFFNIPSIRPNFVVPLFGWEQQNFVDLQPTEIEEQVKRTDENGLIILGEYSKIKLLDWESPTVIRQSLISDKNYILRDNEYHFFPTHPAMQIAGYPFSTFTESSNSTVVWQDGRIFDSPYAEWLAFNPALARFLGWMPVKGKFLGWANEKGDLMVWSIFWQDGLFDMPPPQSDEEVGIGWCVVATSNAFEEIKTCLSKPLKQNIRIEEIWYKNRSEHGKTFVLEKEVVF